RRCRARCTGACRAGSPTRPTTSSARSWPGCSTPSSPCRPPPADRPEPPTMAAPQERYVLTVDLGSTGLKVGLVSLTGEIARCEFALVTTSRPGGGASTQDAEEWWRLVGAASRRVTGSVRPEQLVAASCTGQWASTVP